MTTKTPEERMTELLNVFLKEFSMSPSSDVKLIGIRCDPDTEFMEITTDKCKMHVPPGDLQDEVDELCILHFLDGV